MVFFKGESYAGKLTRKVMRENFTELH